MAPGAVAAPVEVRDTAPGAAGFVANAGQVDPAVAFYSLGPAASVYFTGRGPVLELLRFLPADRDAPDAFDPAETRRRERRRPGVMMRVAVGLRFAGATGPRAIEAIGEPVGRSTRLDARGARPVERFAAIAYRDVWPGIDVLYRHADDGDGLTYEIVARSGADATQARFVYEGADEVESGDGATWAVTPVGMVEDHPPSAAGVGRIRWRLASGLQHADGSPETAGAGEPEVVSASLAWGTFLGGERDDSVYAVTVDAAGRPVVTGATRSADFPTTVGVVDATYEASFDVFVSQLSADGTQVVWSTFLGGTGDDRGWAIALDTAGNPVVVGVTSGDDFPTTAGSFDETPNGVYDAFILKLAADGTSLIWSTLYGGDDSEWDVSGLALDLLGRPIVSGSTRSANLPTTAGAFDGTLDGSTDAFVARFSADGTSLEYGTYLGGSGIDAAEDVASDTSGAAVVVGRTSSADFPATAGAFQPAQAGTSQDGFVARLAPDGGSLEFATYLGGSGTDDPYAVVLDAVGEVLVAGGTSSADFPTTVGSVSPGPLGGEDVFLTRLAAAGDALVWSTYVGGSDSDRALDLVRDGGQGIHVGGWTCSEDLPTTPGALSATLVGPCDALSLIVADDGSAIEYLSYVGGWRDDVAFGIAVDATQRQILVGETWSTNFPVTPGSWAPMHHSPDTWEDGFVIALQVESTCTLVALGSPAPELALQPAAGGACPVLPPSAAAIDLIEGQVASLTAVDVGAVQAIACDTLDASLGTTSIPATGGALFQLARDPVGSYADGGGAGLVGARVPASGDCPP